MKAPKEKRIDLEDHDVSAARKCRTRGKSNNGKEIAIETPTMSVHSFTGSSNPKSPDRCHKDGEYEGKPGNRVPCRGMMIHRHLGTNKELEGLRDVIVKDIERLKEEVNKMKARSWGALAR
ncbi:hypothetical protein Q3G72_001664 [Acer saccharum]|nr:hypothetical protein Q3G72_001664 [Acer saccharum]